MQYKWGEFLHAKGKKFTEFDAIRREIEDETARLTGTNKGISPVPINLRVYSPNVLDLTLVDLPGMTKVAVGDQPHNIESQIKDMLYQFITRENCLILAVTPGNSDLANSDALQIAKEVDPTGIRTIGVITKLDLLDEGTDAKDILENRLLPLRRGYVGVVNRGQKDIEGKKDIKSALAAERKFFLSHPAYRHMAEKMGTPYLQVTLNQQLTNHIRDCLPTLRMKLQKQMLTLEKDVEEYKKFKPDDPSMKMKIMMQMLQKFAEDFDGRIEGKAKVMKQTEKLELSGGAKISSIFRVRFPGDVSRVEYNERKLRKEIGFAIKTSQGFAGGIFTPDIAFDSIVKGLINKMKEPSLRCVDLVINELGQNIKKSAQELSRFPKLQEEVERLARNFIRDQELKCKDQISLYIDIESAFINTNHPDFIGFKEAQRAKTKASSQNKLTNQVLMKGFLTLNLGSSFKMNKEYWFVLTSDNLSWYKDSEEKEQKYNLSLNSLRFKDLEGGGGGFIMKREKLGFVVYSTDRKALYKDKDYLELHCHTMEDLEEWRSGLVRSGVQSDVHEEQIENLDDEDLDFLKDPSLEKDVSMIQSLVDSYMSIVSKTVRDIIPKTVVHMILNNLLQFVKEDLKVNIYAVGDFSEMMIESQVSEQQRKEVLSMYQTTKQALEILSDINNSTISTGVPPPIIDNDDLAPPPRPVVNRTPQAPPIKTSSSPQHPPHPAHPVPPKVPGERPGQGLRAAPRPPVPISRPSIPQRPN
ncbi:Dynamin-1 isoform X10 [Oopsacas minuta]|uniref:dynamin GTPase n=1 Tax=Oopsacas minuta TaxID=111878 RepID=A0AAV7JBS7_9METZ|nr:Dynamin-1 isoform X10 [Oopsacas minuta]